MLNSTKDILQLLTNLKIIVKENYSIDTAFCYFDETIKRYCIMYNPNSEIDSKDLLLHEFAHILRGDLIKSDLQDIKSEEDLTIFNIACDAIINYSLNITNKKYQNFNFIFPVLYETIPYDKSFQLVSKKELFDYIKNKYEQFKKLISQFIKDFQLTTNPEAIKELQRIITIIHLDYPELQEQFNIQTRIYKPLQKIFVQKYISRLQKLLDLLNKITYDYGTYISYRKTINNRCRLSPFIIKPYYSLKICLFVDISGSIEMQNELMKFLNIAEESKKFIIDIYYFAEKVSKNYKEIAGTVTYFTPCLQILEMNSYDAIIILSDFDFFDFNKIQIKQNLLKKYKNRTIIMLTKFYNETILNYIKNLTNAYIIQNENL